LPSQNSSLGIWNAKPLKVKSIAKTGMTDVEYRHKADFLVILKEVIRAAL